MTIFARLSAKSCVAHDSIIPLFHDSMSDFRVCGWLALLDGLQPCSRHSPADRSAILPKKSATPAAEA